MARGFDLQADPFVQSLNASHQSILATTFLRFLGVLGDSAVKKRYGIKSATLNREATF